MNNSRGISNAVLFGLLGALIGIVLLLVFVFPAGSSQEASSDERVTSSATQDVAAGDSEQRDADADADAGSSDAQPAAVPSNAPQAPELAGQANGVNARRAGQIAAAHVGGTVDSVDRERDGRCRVGRGRLCARW